MEADVNLSEVEMRRAGATDYVLRYTLAGDSIQTGMLVYPEGDGGYFLMMAEPPARVAEGMITAREFIFVIDVSGSMGGQPLDVSKQLIRDLFSTLRPTDRFNVVLFESGSRVLSGSGSLPATPNNLERVLAAVSQQNAGGGTELVPALEISYALPEEPGMARSVVIITDGFISAGGEAFAAVRSQLGSANTFAFGVGSRVNRPVIELLARAGNGAPFIVEEFNQADAVAARLRSYIDRPLLTHASLSLNGFNAYDLEPDKVADLLAERPVVVVGRFRGEAQGQVLIEGTAGSAPYRVAIGADVDASSSELSSLRLLWARAKIQRLLDEQGLYYGTPNLEAKNAGEITDLSLTYGLLSPYTSFVAVDEVVRTTQESTEVKQPAIAKPSPAYKVSGTGSALGLVRTLGATASINVPPLKDHSRLRRIGGRNFELHDGTWVDSRYQEDMTLLRLRADSSLLVRLLEAKPELVAAIALGKRVIIVIGDIALLVGPDGFSDFPEETLQTLLRG